jgi:putative redox protein
MPSITAELVEGYQVEISNGNHTWGADEPDSKGGTDTGPTPYEMLLGALAACTCITMSMYARRKGIALEGVSVGYVFERVHADDVQEAEDPSRGYIERVTSEIEIRGDFTDAERDRLRSIAVRCPVHKTLDHGLHFDDNVTLIG